MVGGKVVLVLLFPPEPSVITEDKVDVALDVLRALSFLFPLPIVVETVATPIGPSLVLSNEGSFVVVANGVVVGCLVVVVVGWLVVVVVDMGVVFVMILAGVVGMVMFGTTAGTGVA